MRRIEISRIIWKATRYLKLRNNASTRDLTGQHACTYNTARFGARFERNTAMVTPYLVLHLRRQNPIHVQNFYRYVQARLDMLCKFHLDSKPLAPKKDAEAAQTS